ncbi:uncharacterized protein LOC124260207 [Haliotis rubra]|uniref:uncharacterized protein LOC124260207 n=1 Tax=Haliotis rubra TaxID=36100 RepID=UPI001EE4F952|nr:uncharacterized protein LOC124260207 [Haliotis rubra]
MIALQLTVFTLLICGTCGFSGYWFNMFNHCNPPEQMLGKFCAALLDNDVNGDGRVDGKDIGFDMLYYNYDDDLCTTQKWEFLTRWTCRYGYSGEYARFVSALFSSGGAGDFSSFNMSSDAFLSMQYVRFKNGYCGDPKNRENPIDRVQCAEVDELQPQDVKCA